MPRFYFHVRDASGETQDWEGIDLPHIDAAREKAISGAREIITEQVLKGVLDLTGSVGVINEAGATLLTVRFDEAVEQRRTARSSRLVIFYSARAVSDRAGPDRTL